MSVSDPTQPLPSPPLQSQGRERSGFRSYLQMTGSQWSTSLPA